MTPLFVGIAVALIAVIGLWWSALQKKGMAIRILTVVSGLSLLLGITVIGIYGWALGATDTSQLARALVWGDSEYGDQDQFPVRRMAASSDPIVFQRAAEARVDESGSVRETEH